MSDPISEEAIAWFARVQSDRRTRADEDRFAHWLKQDERHRQAYARVESLWRLAGPQIVPRPLETHARNKWFSAPKIVAAAAVAAMAAGFAFFFTRPDTISAGSFATPAGEQHELKLSDGSTVTLNTRSEVSIDVGKDYRLVRMARGEARFNVAKDAARPFIVDTGSARVRALGTAFDVRVSASRVAVTLVEGRVEVASAAVGTARKPPVVLSAGQQFALDLGSGEQRVQSVSLDRANAWLQRQLIFDALPLSEAVEEANRYLPNPVSVADPSLQDIRVSGVVRAGSVDSLIGSLESSFPVKAIQTPSGPALVRKPD